MKIAVSGKGGVGKTTIAAALALGAAQRGKNVLALDADPDANLARALGVPLKEQEKIVPMAARAELIEERTEAKMNEYGRVFKLNPHVSDVAERFGYTHRGVHLLVLGAIARGGSGCACPESAFAKALVTDLVLYKDDTLIMDMEAGIEHLGRATASGVDIMIIVAEPGQRSIDSARLILTMAGEIGIKRIVFIANKVADKTEEEFIRLALEDIYKTENLPGAPNLLAVLPFSEIIRRADRESRSVFDMEDDHIKNLLGGLYERIAGLM